ncbi:MAG: hypothetical protein WCT07_01125 [Candidatus Paceibacterota bacterium]|jgi:hypothetical protein
MLNFLKGMFAKKNKQVVVLEIIRGPGYWKFSKRFNFKKKIEFGQKIHLSLLGVGNFFDEIIPLKNGCPISSYESVLDNTPKRKPCDKICWYEKITCRVEIPEFFDPTIIFDNLTKNGWIVGSHAN